MTKHRSPVPVGVDELRIAILETIVDKFAYRSISWETTEFALALVSFEIKQAALFAPRVAPAKTIVKHRTKKASP